MQLHICEEQPHASAESAVESGVVCCCLSGILILSSRITGRNRTWKVLGLLIGAIKKQEKVITKMGMQRWGSLASTAFNLKG